MYAAVCKNESVDVIFRFNQVPFFVYVIGQWLNGIMVLYSLSMREPGIIVIN